jgi:hypothetical protein
MILKTKDFRLIWIFFLFVKSLGVRIEITILLKEIKSPPREVNV